MTRVHAPRILMTCALLALGACQSVGGGGAGSLSLAETQDASQTAFTVAAADRCVVPYRQKNMLDALLARSAAVNSSTEHHNDTLRVYDEVFEGTRRQIANDLQFCSKERLAQTRADVARLGG